MDVRRILDGSDPARRAIVLGIVAFAVCAASAAASPEGQAGRAPKQAERGGVIGCPPVSTRTSELGCYMLATTQVGELSDVPLYWYLDTYPARAAAERAKGEHGTVVESLGKVWLLTIAGGSFASAGGERAAKIGPLPIEHHKKLTAAYMEAIMMPGAIAPPHRHPGPEAWYQASGEVCLETPNGKSVGRPGGEAVIVPGGLPMTLRVTGVEKRRSIVLVLHDAARPWTIQAPDWKPKGLCSE
jgi:quercetin dioxygenase-like cupin family protein